MKQFKVIFHMKSSAPIVHTVRSAKPVVELKMDIGEHLSTAVLNNSGILEFDSEGLASSIKVDEVAALTVELDLPPEP